ncbi:MAG: ribosomal L7Ae/L30e/S12e/Gadd45 family protein [Turicibacter sp.]|nr:ribosomal L7Ae/L30e/S12e/Gadd45 family protein [Turicibacter sp.]
MSEKRILSLISLSARANKLVTGEEQAEKSLKKGEACLVIITEDASENTKTKFINKCFFYKKPIKIFGERTTMSKCVGKNNRAVYTVTDEKLAENLQILID